VRRTIGCLFCFFSFFFHQIETFELHFERNETVSLAVLDVKSSLVWQRASIRTNEHEDIEEKYTTGIFRDRTAINEIEREENKKSHWNK
jgi:hypothetical protein